MTDSQYIEVAEKVWGWTRLTEQNFKKWCIRKVWDAGLMTHVDEVNMSSYGKLSLQKQVNSWTGFGRTVDAMADKLYFLDVVKGQFGFYQHRSDECPDFHKIDTTILIEATHLAALEALSKVI